MRMIMTQQDKQALQDNWDQVKSQLRSQFPGLTEADIASGQSSPDQLATMIAQRTGQSDTEVANQLTQIAQQYRQS